VDKRAAALARLFEDAPVGVYIGALDGDETSTAAANLHLKLILGHSGDTKDALVRPFDAQAFADAAARDGLIARLRNDGNVSNYLTRLRRVDGEFVWVEVTGRAKPEPADGHAERLRLEVFIRDVSERKRLDNDTRNLYHQLLQAEKMAALGQTISGVAHELNNPLATILSWAERLTSNPNLDPSVRRGIEIILSESERSARIVRTLLTFARKRQTTRAMVDVNQIVRETLSLRAYEQRVTNISVIAALAAGLPAAFADGHQIQQVLLNLIINAEQAMISTNGNGVLVVRTWHDQLRESVVIEINDDGPGIAQDLQPKIFDPFFTTKEVGKGTGLGLTVAYAIVQEHGGRIRVESRPGGGASFFVEFPVNAAPAPQASPAMGRKVPTRAVGAASVLVVDDERALAAAVLEALGDAGYTVEHALDGEQGLAKARAKSFDLVICDLKMPRLDGRAFFRALTASDPAMKSRVIFVTGDVAGTDAENFLEESGCRWFAKPFRLADLLRAVKEVLTA
jgi:signal transduction histidine kinase